MKLTVSWDDFKQAAKELVNQGELISEREKTVKNESELEIVKSDMKSWREEANTFLKSSFDSENNNIAHEVYYAKNQRFHIANVTKPFVQVKKESFEDFKMKWATLVYYIRLLEVCDAIVRPEKIHLNERLNYTTQDTLHLILDKLYDLYDDEAYSVKFILIGNGIPLKRNHEERELVKVLEDNGYIQLGYGAEISAQLTTTGRLYVEENRKSYKEDYSTISSNETDINSRVDKITEMLTNLGYGQEIIFNEIDELKELYKTLNKKNWGQIVKGKVVDLALGKLVDNDTLKYVYETLTSHKLHLP